MNRLDTAIQHYFSIWEIYIDYIERVVIDDPSKRMRHESCIESSHLTKYS